MNGHVTRTAALGSATGCELSRILAARDSSADHETPEPLAAMVYTRSCTLMEPTTVLKVCWIILVQHRLYENP